ncbi:unnamed protein product [Psylliodes chrysocephalus]|uniref:Cytochrome b561 domain-containing protein n=1 Tax=Psylliodes chrysocephalus TaxID=3402493 RepID=A0A9P0CSL1_9CUCU|nr:unnamed protein product [Psylliodes chrysocephala]
MGNLHCSGGFGLVNPDLIFNWHPLLMVIGMVFIFSHAILLYRTGRHCCKSSMKLTHGIFHSLTILLISLGLAAAFSNHIMKKIPNMYTLHSWIGMMAIIIFITNFIFALGCMGCPGTTQKIRDIGCPVHIQIGIVCFLVAIVAAVLGVAEKTIFGVKNYKDMPGEGVICNLIGLLMVIYGILILCLVTDASYKRQDKRCATPCPPSRPPLPPTQYYYGPQMPQMSEQQQQIKWWNN